MLYELFFCRIINSIAMKISLFSLILLFSAVSSIGSQDVIPARKVIDVIKQKKCDQAFKMLNLVDDLNYRDKAGGTMLMYCSVYGCNDVAYWLIEKGARIDLKSNEGFTALHMASRNGHSG